MANILNIHEDIQYCVDFSVKHCTYFNALFNLGIEFSMDCVNRLAAVRVGKFASSKYQFQ